ncbi:MAG: zinc ribbon domain-containing protein [Actinomycetota bacterium]|nr:zinc ribbon domain-containing protein [Actinomycetota bacterium]MDD5667358.1 zinc ribbon domain-containing protein [Actinomycetota bacterium]
MPARLYCPQCLSFGDPQAEFCTSCGTKLIPLMRVVIMPFVESGQEPDSPGEHRGLVEREGELQPSQAIGCQMYMTSDLEAARLIVSHKETYFAEAERMLPNMVKGFLDPLGFYDIPDPGEVDLVTVKAANMPTELFVLIQDQYDPEYLFLPEIEYFFFRYPRLHTSGRGDDSGFGYAQISAFLLDNRENRIVSRGHGAGLETHDVSGDIMDENYSIPLESQLEIMRIASAQAVEGLLKSMKMAR